MKYSIPPKLNTIFLSLVVCGVLYSSVLSQLSLVLNEASIPVRPVHAQTPKHVPENPPWCLTAFLSPRINSPSIRTMSLLNTNLTSNLFY